MEQSPSDPHRNVAQDVPVQKTAEQETLRLREEMASRAREEYRTLFENIDEGVAMCELVRDENGNVVDYRFWDVNPAFEIHLNVKRSEVVGRLGNDILPEDRDALAMYAGILSSQKTFRREYFSGALQQWYDITVVPRGGDRFAVVFDNITRHKQTEEQLTQAAGLNAFRVKLNEALDPLGDPFQILREAMRVIGEQLRVDRAMYAEVNEDDESCEIAENYVRGDIPPITGRFSLQTLGAASDTLRKGQVLAINDVRAAPGLQKGERAMLISIGVAAALAVPLIKDGRWVACLAVQHNTAREWTISEMALVQETAERTWAVLERARAEDAMRQSEIRYRLLHENLRDAFVQVDMEGNLISFNEIYCEMMGYSSEELQGLTYQDLTPERWHALEEQIVREQILPRGFSDVYEKEYRRKDGTVFPVELRTILWRDPSGRPTAMWAIIRAITDRKRAEEALRENERQLQLLNESLEQKVEEKTSELRQLASELTRAEQRERNRISHILHDDLQQRVYAVQMQLSFLQDELGAGNQAALIEAGNLGRELDEILKIARNLSIELNPPILRGEGLTQAISWLASKMQQQYGLPIEIHAGESFMLEDEELHVLLFNCVRELLFNAVKHAQASRADVRLQWVDDHLCIEVADNGRGLPVTGLAEAEDELGGEVELQASFGLSTIRHQLSLYGGRMEIHSQPGAGTQILLSVPASRVE